MYLPFGRADFLVATEVEGIFRLAGAERRIKELQAIFNSPERYGKGLDWTGYTVHDAANVLRRYLNLLPEPIVPREFYARFREPLLQHQAEAVGEKEGQGPDVGNFDIEGAIRTYQQLITEIPPLNRQLLLYLLDLLAVFAAKAEQNLMTAHNLSSIFQPGLIHDPSHNFSPAEYRLNQDVLIFLIEKQDHFLVGMQGTAADEQTIQEVQSGAPSPQIPSSSPTTPKSRAQQLIGRSSSTASAGSESARRFGAIRRNLSVSSKNSRQSNNTSSPVTPPPGGHVGNTGKSNMVHRSNTVPSKKSPSPALAQQRFQSERATEHRLALPTRTSPYSSGPSTPALASVDESPVKTGIALASKPGYSPPQNLSSLLNASKADRALTPEGLNSLLANQSPHLKPSIANTGRTPSQDQILVSTPNSAARSPLLRPSVANVGRIPSQDQVLSRNDLLQAEVPNSTGKVSPAKDRAFGQFFKSSGSTEAEKRDGKKPNKLQKKRAPEGMPSAGSSTLSLGGGSLPLSPAFHSQASGSRRESQAQMDGQYLDPPAKGVFERRDQHSPHRPSSLYVSAQASPDVVAAQDTTPLSTLAGETLLARQSPEGSLTSSGNDFSSPERTGEADLEKKKEKKRRWRLSSSGKKKQANGTGLAAQRSTSTVGSAGRSRKSMTDESYTTNASMKSHGGEERMDSNASVERKGAFGWFKDKFQRARSPPPPGSGVEQSKSKQSLNAMIANSESS